MGIQPTNNINKKRNQTDLSTVQKYTVKKE